MQSVGKVIVGFIGGGLTACAGVLISINPLTTKIMQIVGPHFANAAFAGDVVLKVCGVIFITGLAYLIGKNLSKEYLKGFIIGTVSLTVLDLAAFIFASMK